MHHIHNKASFDDSPVALLYDRYAQTILHSVSRYTSSKEDADDLVLEVFLAIMENQVWMTWKEEEQVAWLRRIAHNKAVDHCRRTTRHPSVALESADHTLYDNDERMPEHIALRNEDHAILRTYLSNLSELQQEIVRLRFGHNLRSKEIAQRLNKSDTLVRVLLSRALNLLRSMYQKQEGGF